MVEKTCPLCSGQPPLASRGEVLVCLECGYVARTNQLEPAGVGERLLGASDTRGGDAADPFRSTAGGGGEIPSSLLTSSKFAHARWARREYPKMSYHQQSVQNTRMLLGRFSARIPAIGSVKTVALEQQVEKLVWTTLSQARSVKWAHREFKRAAFRLDDAPSLGERSAPELAYLSTDVVAHATSATGAPVLDVRQTQALVSANLHWGARGHGNALVAAALVAQLLLQGSIRIPLDPLAKVAETSVFNITTKYRLLAQLNPILSRHDPLDPRAEIPGLMTRMRTAQAAIRTASPRNATKRQRLPDGAKSSKSARQPGFFLASAAAQALGWTDLGTVEKLAMDIGFLFGAHLGSRRSTAHTRTVFRGGARSSLYTTGLHDHSRSGSFRRDPLTDALACIWLALEACTGTPFKRHQMANLLTVHACAPSAETLSDSLIAGPKEWTSTGTLLHKYDMYLIALRQACHALDWVVPHPTKIRRQKAPPLGWEPFWDKPRLGLRPSLRLSHGDAGRWGASGEQRNLSRVDLIRYAQAVVAVRVAEKKHREAQQATAREDDSIPTAAPRVDGAHPPPDSTTTASAEHDSSSLTPRNSATAAAPHQDEGTPSVAALRGITSWAMLDRLPDDESDRLLFQPGELDGYLRSPEAQKAYLASLDEADYLTDSDANDEDDSDKGDAENPYEQAKLVVEGEEEEEVEGGSCLWSEE